MSKNDLNTKTTVTCKYIFEGKHDEYPQFYVVAPTHDEMLDIVTKVTGWMNFYIDDPERIKLQLSYFSVTFQDSVMDDDVCLNKYVIQDCTGMILYNENIMPMDFLMAQFDKFNTILVIEPESGTYQKIIDKNAYCQYLLAEVELMYLKSLTQKENPPACYGIRYKCQDHIDDDTYHILEDKGYAEKLKEDSQVMSVGNDDREYILFFVE